MHRPHGINECVVIFCTSGRGLAEIDGRKFRVSTNTALIIPANKPHSYAADERDPWSIFWAHFGGTAAASYTSLLPPGDYAPRLRQADALKVSKMFREGFVQLSKGHTARTLLLVSHILRHVLAVLFFQNAPASRAASPDAHDLNKSIEFMRANISRPLSLEELSSQAGLSQARYTALFRAQTGSSPVEHHTRLRMQAACHHLDTTSLQVKEVAAKVGFSDPYYFSRVFQKTLGYSPRAYRRSFKG
jgi:AraC-like DNA-binding protein